MGTPSERLSGRSLFLGIGINAYQDNRMFPKLQNAVNDVQTISQLLYSYYEFDECELLIDAEANKDNIMNTLHRYFKNLSDNDKLLIYFSGHGYRDTTEHGSTFTFWAPVDAKSGNINSVISNDLILEYLRKIPARHIFLISDSCYSGSFLSRSGPPKEEAGRRAQMMESLKSRFGLFSGRDTQTVKDGGHGPHSPFAQAIITVLSQNRRLQMNAFIFSELVGEQARENEGGQDVLCNVIPGCGDQNGRYIFWLRPEPLDFPLRPENENKEILQIHKRSFPSYKVGQEIKINIPFITEKILIAMEKSLRQCRDLLLKDVELNLQEGHWAIRDLCVQKAHTTVDILNDLDSLTEELEKYSLGSETLFDRISYLERKFTNELYGTHFQFVSKVKQKKLAHAFNSPLEEAAFLFKKCRDIVLQAVEDDLAQKLGLKNRLSDISTQLQLLYLILENLVSATDTHDWTPEVLN